MNDAPSVAHIERVWADDNVAFARSLQALDASWRTETFPLADGHVVLSGAGLYVNVALACGVDRDLSVGDLDVLASRCEAVGVVPAIELTAASTDVTRDVVIGAGYAPSDSVAALLRRLDDHAGDHTVNVDDLDWSIRTVDDADDMRAWQHAAALGWGHDSDARRRASDAFVAAVFATEGQTLFLAEDPAGSIVGCASVQVREDLSTLGGMSTLPAHRRRGVQSALVEHRLAFARRAGATWAVSTTEPDGASERNLMRAGFVRSHVKETYQLETYEPRP